MKTRVKGAIHSRISIIIYALLIMHTIQAQTADQEMMHTFYDFTFTDLSGKTFDFADLKGKRVLIVNTASECGFTPQYAQLQELYEQFKDHDFVIVSFPANNFGGQEPGNNAEIKTFCKKNYGVSFPMMQKLSVKGDDIHPLFQWLTQKEKNGVSDAVITWNFNKFLIDEDGNWVAHYTQKVEPLEERIMEFAEGK